MAISIAKLDPTTLLKRRHNEIVEAAKYRRMQVRLPKYTQEAFERAEAASKKCVKIEGYWVRTQVSGEAIKAYKEVDVEKGKKLFDEGKYYVLPPYARKALAKLNIAIPTTITPLENDNK